jgi:hypothetical protein
VEDPADVHADFPKELARIAAFVAEGDWERGRRDDVPKGPPCLGGVVEIERREVADGAGELFDLTRSTTA